MILGIDASNIHSWGGITHLSELLRAADPGRHGFEQVILWAGEPTHRRLEDRDWLRKQRDPLLERGRLSRFYWQKFRLAAQARAARCDVLFVPSGTDAVAYRPMVTMSQNLLPFDWPELRRFGLSVHSLKYTLLRFAQTRTFRRADDVVFLTRFAREAVLKVTGPLRGEQPVIPHGMDGKFFHPPRPQRHPDEFTAAAPCRVLYVSIVDLYKHQWHVVEGIAKLRSQGLEVVLELVGPPKKGTSRLLRTMEALDPKHEFVRYLGAVPYDRIQEKYLAADIYVLASSCETFGQVLTEAMASGLPIACSNRSALPEILGDSGAYFDPEKPVEIAAAVGRLMASAELRERLAQGAYEKAQRFSWSRCAEDTFALLARVGKGRTP